MGSGEAYFSSRVRRDPNGNGWRAVLYYRDESGKVRERSRKLPGVRSEGAARRALDAWRAELERDAIVREEELRRGTEWSKATVGEYVTQVISGKSRTASVERKTVADYEFSLARMARGGLADIPLSELTYEEVQDWIEGLLTGADGGKPLSNLTVVKTYNMLRMCVRDAYLRHLIPENPCDGLKPPKKVKKKAGINSLPTAARRTIVSSLLSFEPSRVTCAAMISIYTGLREGEVCGLQWGDLDDFSPTLWVRRAIGVTKGGSYVKLSKTDRIRDVALPDSLVRYLRLWRTHQERSFSDLGARVLPSTYIIGTVDGYTSPDVISHEWPVIARAIGVRGTAGRIPTFHDLRHTWITMYLAAGGDVMTAASNAGHASAAMTLDIYASADPQAKAASREITERAMLGGGPGATPGSPSAPDGRGAEATPDWFGQQVAGLACMGEAPRERGVPKLRLV